MKTTNQTYTLAEEALLKKVRRLRDMEPLYAEDIRADTAAAEEYLKLQLRQHYTTLLLTLPVEDLPLTDSTEDSKTVRIDASTSELLLPRGTLRIAEVKLRGWARPARLTTEDTPLGKSQASPYSRSGRELPTGVIYEGGRVLLYGEYEGETPRAERILTISQPEAGTYTVTPQVENELIKRMSDYDTR